MTTMPSVGRLWRPTAPVTDLAGNQVEAGTSRGPRVFVCAHADCRACHEWIDQAVAGAREAIAEWDGRVFVVAGGNAGHGGRGVDEPEKGGVGEPRAETRGAGWIAVTDEWGEVVHFAALSNDHAFPDLTEVVEWARFVAIQCPECEGPEGDWRGGP